MSIEQPHYQWDAFHGGSPSDEARHQDKLDEYRACPQHDYQTWAGNPCVLMCVHCRDWHFKT